MRERQPAPEKLRGFALDQWAIFPSVSLSRTVNFANWMTKRASATESFCSNADKLSATPDTT